MVFAFDLLFFNGSSEVLKQVVNILFAFQRLSVFHDTCKLLLMLRINLCESDPLVTVIRVSL